MSARAPGLIPIPMNSKVTLPELTDQLAESCGCSKRLASDFLHEFFAIAAEALEQGESVRIKGIGTFKLNAAPQKRSVSVASGEEYTVPEHGRVSFVPSKELAAAVNYAFEAFQSVELAADVDERILAEAEPSETITAPLPAEEAEIPSEPEPDFPENSESSEPSESFENSENSENSQTSEPSESSPLPEDEYFEEYDEPAPRRRFGWGFLVGFASAIVALLIAAGLYVYFVGFPSKEMLPKWARVYIERPAAAPAAADHTVAIPSDTLASIAPDSLAINNTEAAADAKAPTAPSDVAVVYDTISTTRFLTTMAREHYGNFHLWPYIYNANAAVLGHPDRIRPGTRVVVPDLKALGVNPKSESAIEEAKREGARIYARYK